jgi:hypothetical protein
MEINKMGMWANEKDSSYKCIVLTETLILVHWKGSRITDLHHLCGGFTLRNGSIYTDGSGAGCGGGTVIKNRCSRCKYEPTKNERFLVKVLEFSL